MQKYHNLTPKSADNRKQIQQKSKTARKNLMKDVLDKVFYNFNNGIEEILDYVCFVCKKLYYKRQIVYKSIEEYDSEIFADYLPVLFVCCNRCDGLMKKKKVPSMAHWNNMVASTIPDKLKLLSEIELKLLSRIHPFLKIIHLGGRFGQYGFKGQAVLFAQRVEEIAEQLPLSIQQAGIVIVSELKDVASVSKQYTISIPKLEAALKWLIENNKLYKSVKINIPSKMDIANLIIYSVPKTSHPPDEVEQEILPEFTSAFTILDNNTSILRGNFHQANPRFGEVGGKQCTAIAATAIVTSHFKNCSTWRSADIDSTLLTGSRYYQECRSKLTAEPVYLMSAELLPTLIIANVEYNIAIIPDIIIGITIPHESSQLLEGIYGDLLRGIEAFFLDYNYGILTIKGITVAIAHQEDKYWLFDSHSRGPKGFVGRNRGTAMLMSFSSIQLLHNRIECITKSNRNSQQYVIASISARLGEVNVTDQVGADANLDNISPIPTVADNLLEPKTVTEPVDDEENNYYEIDTTALMNINIPVPNIEDVLQLSEIDDDIPQLELKRKCAAPVSALIEKRAEELAWYHLYPNGKNGLMEDRLVHITPLDYFQSRVMGEDNQFQRIDYLFYALSMVELFKVKSNVAVCGRLQQQGAQAQNLVQNLHLSMRQIRGSSSYWHSAYCHLLAMVRTLGAPTWYLTFSCNNLNWHDILKALLRADNRFDVTPEELTFNEKKKLVDQYPVVLSRQFMRRVHQMMQAIKSNDSILGGHVEDYWWRIEFQLRGSPHVHMVVWCPSIPKFDTPDGIQIIDEVISCSSSVLDSELQELVDRLQRHKHTPTCFKKNKDGNKRCRFGYPRETSPVTSFLEPDEAIKHGGRFCILKRVEIDNMINNYNPTLLKLWKANIDIQLCGSAIGLAYYISKYIAKSEPTLISTCIKKALDEIRNCKSDVGKQMFIVSMAILNQRQVSASECAFRLCHLKLRDSSRRCVFINNCSPDQRYRILKINTNDVFDNIFDKYVSRPLTLEDLSLAEFAVKYDSSTTKVDGQDDCDEDMDFENEAEAEQTRAKYITLLNRKGRMKLRNRSAVLRTRYFSLTSNREEYYYGLLVCHIPFRDETTLLEGYNSSSEAFYAKKDLLKPITNTSVEEFANIENEIHDAIRKIVAEKIAADIDSDNVNNIDIDNDILVQENVEGVSQDDLLELENNRMTDIRYTNAVASLNGPQRNLLSTVSKFVTDDKGQLLMFVTGGAGSGKSYILKLIVEHIRRLTGIHSSVIIAAPTGVAAKLIGGQTLHSVFSLPIQKGSYGNLNPLSGEQLQRERNKWRNINWLIIDEISMVSYHVLRMIHQRLLQFKENANQLFSGVNVLLFGDLMQLPPVSKFSSQSYCFHRLSDYAGEIHLWRCFSFCELSTNMRQQGNSAFIDILNNLRVGQLNMEQIEILDNCRHLVDTDYFSDAIHVYPTTKQVDSFNTEISDKLKEIEEVVSINALDRSIEPKTSGQIPNPSVIPKDQNRTAGMLPSICIGKHSRVMLRVMLRRNISIQQGLVNGSIGTIIDIKWPNLRDAQLEEGELPESVTIKFDDLEQSVIITPMVVQFDGLKGYGKIERRMLPLILCWAVTVHKLQGVTLSKAVINLGSKLFAKGQAYVALSRVKSIEGLAISELHVGRLLNKRHDEHSLAELERLRGTVTSEEQGTPDHGKL